MSWLLGQSGTGKPNNIQTLIVHCPICERFVHGHFPHMVIVAFAYWRNPTVSVDGRWILVSPTGGWIPGLTCVPAFAKFDMLFCPLAMPITMYFGLVTN